jgi:hypothetical protein
MKRFTAVVLINLALACIGWSQNNRRLRGKKKAQIFHLFLFFPLRGYKSFNFLEWRAIAFQDRTTRSTVNPLLVSNASAGEQACRITPS